MSRDLASRHELVGNLLRLPQSPTEWERFRLSDEQVAFFDENGYLAGIQLLTPQQCDLLLEELQELVDPQHPGHDLFYEFQWMVDELHGGGDATVPRGLDAAIHEGYRLGVRI